MKTLLIIFAGGVIFDCVSGPFDLVLASIYIN